MPTINQFFDSQIRGKADQIYDYEPYIDATGDLRRIEGIDVAIRAIRTLLLTPLGYYPFDPEYGSLLYKKVFEMADRITQMEVEFEVRERIKMYENRVTVERVQSGFIGDGKTLVVDVYIDRLGVKGKVSVILEPQKSMFGLEDKLTEDIL
jgi:phage baseplate assembly protein W